MGASTKFLYVVVLAVIALTLYLVLTGGANQTANALLDKGFKAVSEAGVCGLGAITTDACSKSTDKSGNNCVKDESGETNFDCTLCERDVGGATVYKCSLATCGCGFGWKQSFGSISVDLIGEPYKTGEKIRATGKITSSIIEDLTGATVEFSFLDGNKQSTDKLGKGGTTGTNDKDGNFRLAYDIPSGAELGKYFLFVRFKNTWALAEFSVTQ